MRRFSCPTALLVALFSVLFSSAQTANYPNTLLWRISGKHLKKPSYLFGTMHLQDKRLFNFGDSLYHSIESVEGLATEIDFKEYMDSIFTKGLHKAEDEILAKQRVKLDRSKIDKSSDSLLKALGLDRDNLTRKDLKRIRDYRVNKMLKKGEMPTVVDGYLVALALRQRKWVGGIEDVVDQLNLMDEFGSDLTPDKVLQKESVMQQGLEEMIKMYVNQDLNQINYTINNYDASTRDEILIRRNIKMARRMDSLSAIRTMFFAVGAAHLPGDSGVISLLRRSSFTVEPVFSSEKIAAEVYVKKLGAIPWYTVEDDSKIFTVEMPGNPSHFNEFGEAAKMKMFFDITTMTFYMASQSIGGYKTAKEFNEAMKEMAARMGVSSKAISPKVVDRNGIEGREAYYKKEGIAFRVQLLQKNNSVFVLIAGSVNESSLTSQDVNRFFNSFNTYEVQAAKAWTKFSLPEKSFSVMLPGQPKRNAAIDRIAEGTSWQFATYDYSDVSNGLYYMVQVRDLKEGMYLQGDSSFFFSYAEEMKSKMDSVVRTRLASHQGFPAFRFDAINQGYWFKMFHVIRGNRIFLLMTGGRRTDSLPEAETLFNSISFEEQKPATWKTEYSEGFSSYVPRSFNRITGDDTTDKRDQFIAVDQNKAISYQVLKEALPPLYWEKNDSTFFAHRIDGVDEGDSILKRSFVYNGKLKALELVVEKPDLNNLKKVRYIVSGDTLFTLLSFIPRQYIDEPEQQRFFNDFKIAKELSPTIYSNKADQLLEALKSKDSLTNEKAATAFKMLTLTKDDLPFLHKALLEVSEENSYDAYDVQYKIKQQLIELNDPSTIEFIEKTYSQLGAEKEALKYELLRILAEHKTDHSYTVLKGLLNSDLPKKGESHSLSYSLLDSLKLTASIYSTLLPLAKDSLFSDVVARITWHLLDSGLVKLEQLAPYENELMQQANTKFKEATEKEDEEYWDYYNWIKLLQRLKNKEATDLLQQITLTKSIHSKYSATIALLKNGQTVQPKVLEELAADKSYRSSLYSYLKENNQTRLFPAKYLTQKSISESELYNIVSDDYEPSALSFISERTMVFKGEKKKFYLFKVQYGEGEEQETYLGVAGAYPIGSKEIIEEADATGLHTESFDAKKTDQQLKAYLKEVESYNNEE